MNLVRAELRRAVSRRLFRLLVGLAVVLSVGGGILAFTRSSSLDEQVYKERVQSAQEAVRAAEARVQECARDAPGGRPNEECFVKFPSPPRDPRFHLEDLKGILQGVAGVFALVAWLLGASLIGSEYQSRSLTTTLTFEPRRVRLFATKAGVAVALAALFALAVSALVALVMLPSATFHGAPRAGEPGIATLIGVALRGGVLAACTCGIGFAVATIGRNTAAALGVGFGYIIVVEQIVGGFLEGMRRWLLLGNIIVLVTGENSGGDVPGRSVVGAGLFLAAVALGLLVLAGLAFSERDVA